MAHLSIRVSSHSLWAKFSLHDLGMAPSPSLQPRSAPATAALASESPPCHKITMHNSFLIKVMFKCQLNYFFIILKENCKLINFRKLILEKVKLKYKYIYTGKCENWIHISFTSHFFHFQFIFKSGENWKN